MGRIGRVDRGEQRFISLVVPCCQLPILAISLGSNTFVSSRISVGSAEAKGPFSLKQDWAI